MALQCAAGERVVVLAAAGHRSLQHAIVLQALQQSDYEPLLAVVDAAVEAVAVESLMALPDAAPVAEELGADASAAARQVEIPHPLA